MKTISCLFMSIIFALTLNAQVLPTHIEHTAPSTDSIELPQPIWHTKSQTKASVWVLDSMISYQRKNGQMSLYRKMFVLQVDEYHNPAKLITIVLDTNTKQWINKDSIALTYYGYNKIHTHLTLPWDKCNSTWADTGKYEELTQKGITIIYISKDWDENKCKFVDGEKEVYTLKNEGSYESQIRYRLDTTSITWAKYRKAIYYYNSNNQLSSIINQKRNDSTQAWYNYEKRVYEYNSHGLLTTSYTMLWDNTNQMWVYSRKIELQYDSLKRVSKLIFYLWDTTNNQWVKKLHALIEYSTNQRTHTYQKWDVFFVQWVNYIRIIYHIDNAGNLVDQIYQRWNTTNNRWINIEKFEYVYDYSLGIQTEYNYYQWNTRSWLLQAQDRFYYSRVIYNGLEHIYRNLIIHPNPAHNELIINNFTQGEYKITTLYGKILLHNKLHNNRINIQALPSGIYILEIKNDTKKYHSKFIKL